MLNQFSRTELLLGKDNMERPADIRWRLLPEAVWALLI